MKKLFVMNERQRRYVNEYIYRKFLLFMDCSDASRLADSITDGIVNDIEETAGEDWHSGDIDIALSRLMVNTFCEE